MELFENYIKSFPHYKPEILEGIRSHITLQNLEAGDYFLMQGKISRDIAFIEKGIMRLYYLRDGIEVTTCFHKEASITCSYRSLITETPSDVAIQAIEPCTVVVFSYDSLQQLYTKDLFWQQVGRLAAEKEYIDVDSYKRFLNDLTATERYQQILDTDQELIQRVPLKYLASYLQITPETLSRIRKKITRPSLDS